MELREVDVTKLTSEKAGTKVKPSVDQIVNIKHVHIFIRMAATGPQDLRAE